MLRTGIFDSATASVKRVMMKFLICSAMPSVVKLELVPETLVMNFFGSFCTLKQNEPKARIQLAQIRGRVAWWGSWFPTSDRGIASC